MNFYDHMEDYVLPEDEALDEFSIFDDGIPFAHEGEAPREEWQA